MNKDNTQKYRIYYTLEIRHTVDAVIDRRNCGTQYRQDCSDHGDNVNKEVNLKLYTRGWLPRKTGILDTCAQDSFDGKPLYKQRFMNGSEVQYKINVFLYPLVSISIIFYCKSCTVVLIISLTHWFKVCELVLVVSTR